MARQLHQTPVFLQQYSYRNLSMIPTGFGRVVVLAEVVFPVAVLELKVSPV